MGSRAGVVVLAALVPLASLAFDPAGWYWFGPSKWLVVSTLVPAAAALILATRPLIVVTRPAAAAGALVAVMALAAAFAVDPLYAWIGTPERRFGAVTWVLCLVSLLAGMALTRQRDGPVLLAGVALAALGVGLAATIEALGWEPAVFDVGGRLSGTFGSPAYLGAVAALLLPACVGGALDTHLARPMRAVAAAASPLLVVATVGSGARAAWTGLVAAGAIAVFARRDALRRHPRRAAVLAGVTAIVMAIAAIASPAGSRVVETFDRDAPGGQGRIDEWRVATRVLLDHPVLGVGPEGYRIAFSDGVDADYERTHGRDPLPDRAHSSLLDIGLAGGLPAIAAWLAFLAFASRHVWRALRTGPRWLVGVAAGLIAHVTGSLVLFPIAEIEPLAWLLAGVTMAATARPGEVREVVVARPVAIAFGCIAVVAAGAGVLDVMADRRARDAVDALAEGRTADAYAHATDAASLRPDEVRLHLLAARVAVADERGTLVGLDHLDRALDRSPDDPIVRRERATLLIERARATMVPAHAAAARDEVAGLVADDPHNAALRMLEGDAALLVGDVASAEAAWLLAADLAPGDPAPAAAIAALDRSG